jgi:hypothetical protein
MTGLRRRCTGMVEALTTVGTVSLADCLMRQDEVAVDAAGIPIAGVPPILAAGGGAAEEKKRVVHWNKGERLV